MSSQSNCSSAWNQLITAINQDKTNLGTLIQPYGLNICQALLELPNINQSSKKLSYKDIEESLNALKEKVNEQRKEFENEKSQNEELKTKNEQSDRENKILESQNYQKDVGLGLGIPAAGAAGAGAVIGLPLLVKFVKSWIT